MMRMLESNIAINLDVLDANETAISGAVAWLCHLDGEWASLMIPRDSVPACLHWGARVRFWLDSAERGIEVFGTVTEHNIPRNGGIVGAAEEDAESFAVRVRLQRCERREQRRQDTRRRIRFPVRLRDLTTGAEEGQDNEAGWREGWCVDLSRGGMRLRLGQSAPVSGRIMLEFALPGRAVSGQLHARQSQFRLSGRALRCVSVPRAADTREVAVKFERLSAEEGAALAAFLAPAKAA